MNPSNEGVSRKPLILFLIAIMIFAGPLGNVLLGKGMKQVGSLWVWPPPKLIATGIKIFGAGSIWLGIASLMIFMVAYMLVLSLADYSYVQPVSSFAYAVVALLGHLMLGEYVSWLQCAGIAVISMGVFVVSRTNPQTTEQF
jgi:drug/metabolite transporter (DMT)-like permease